MLLLGDEVAVGVCVVAEVAQVARVDGDVMRASHAVHVNHEAVLERRQPHVNRCKQREGQGDVTIEYT